MTSRQPPARHAPHAARASIARVFAGVPTRAPACMLAGALAVAPIGARAAQEGTGGPPIPPAIARAVAAPTRSPALVARDAFRHPAEELAFFGVTPRSDVVEIYPGGGYWTQILAPLLRQSGTYTVALGVANGDGLERAYAPPKFRALLQSDPTLYGRIHETELGRGHGDIAPAGTVDLVLTFRNLHNWIKDGDAPEILADIGRALKPGGVLGIEDHRARPDTPRDPKAENGYVHQDDAIRLVESAGFRFAGSSEIDANPKDTTDWPQGVWTLPPTYALGAQDHAKYEAIGEADNFVLKFVKPPA